MTARFHSAGPDGAGRVPMLQFDQIVIGGGIAGASLAYHLARHGRVALLERESQPGYHATGRSAAIYTKCYGPRSMRVMTHLSGPFLRSPPAGFSDTPLLTPLGVLFVACEAQRGRFTRRLAELREVAPDVTEVDVDEARRRCPGLPRDYLAAAALDDQAMNMDVHALHAGYLRAARRAGAAVLTSTGVDGITRRDGSWQVQAGSQRFTAGVVVNAAGAWADELAILAGVQPVGLTPKRRTAVLFDAPAGQDPRAWSAAWDIDDGWYFKPEGRQILATPGDETPVPPHDVQPEEIDIALAAHRLELATTLRPRRMTRAWAGLRTFAADGEPVVGFDAAAEGFFWLAGQGGYGIKTSWALGLTAASLIRHGKLPGEVAAFGLRAEDLGPRRLRNAA